MKQKIPESVCCSMSPVTVAIENNNKSWNRIYFMVLSVLTLLWGFVYFWIEQVANWFVLDLFGLKADSHLAHAIEFFIYDTVKILLLLIGLIYVISWMRAYLDVERVRNFLLGKRKGIGYCFGAFFGAITPFCSCSSIPLFLGFVSTGIPIGITMSFLITLPIINEIAIVLLWNLLGWKLTVIYVVVGLMAGIIGGIVMDTLKAERWLQLFIIDTIRNTQISHQLNSHKKIKKLTVRQRHIFAYSEMTSILKRVWKWIVIGVAIGAALHGYVPKDWFAQYFSAGQWWTVPSAVLLGIPLYSNVTGIIPIMESLLVKGLPLGTTLAFCMSAVAASIPEVIMLRQIMTLRLQAVFIGYLWVIFTIVGWIFNGLQFQIM